MEKKRISYLLQKLKTGQASVEEREEIESFWAWARQDQSVIDNMTEEERHLIKRTIFEGIESRISELDLTRGKQVEFSRRAWFLKVAAAIAFLVMMIWFLLPDERQSFYAGYGKHVRLVLPDSSSVILNGNSVIRYDPEWRDDKPREVWIEGEAFFDVTHTENDQKFIVHTKAGIDVEVLGTRFNVKIRRGEAQVMLEAGKVRLDVSGIFSSETVMLKPGELGSLAGDELIVGVVNPFHYSAWKEDLLYFNETPLKEVANILEDTYGMEVVFEDEKLEARKLSGQINARDAKDILLAIAEVFNIGVKEKGRKVIFHLKN